MKYIFINDIQGIFEKSTCPKMALFFMFTCDGYWKIYIIWFFIRVLGHAIWNLKKKLY
jgi:hypothetical protein